MRSAIARWCGLALLLLGAAGTRGMAAPAPVALMRVDGAISVASADHVHRGLKQAAAQHAQLVVLQIDTPGGLDVAMRTIVRDILASEVPVATFVAPNGARAASAGTYILYASHLAAMAPASNLGAATPVAIGVGGAAAPSASGAHEPDTMTAKQVHDAAAYLRSLAQLRGRNVEWAEQAVRRSVSLAASEALEQHVIDVVAYDVPDLLRSVDGRALQLGERRVTLETRDAPLLAIDADWRSRLLAVIADPSLALMLMMVGIYGLLFEFSSPGFVLPGVVGGISLLLGLFALQMLPINYAGLALILLGLGFFVAEAFVPSYGTLGLGGAVAFACGALLLFDSDTGYGLPPGFIGVLTAGSAVFVIGIAGMAARARRRPVVSGPSAMLGATGELVEFAAGAGWALVNGEHWRVHGPGGLRPGDAVQVTGAHGALLDIGPARATTAHLTTRRGGAAPSSSS